MVSLKLQNLTAYGRLKCAIPKICLEKITTAQFASTEIHT